MGIFGKKGVGSISLFSVGVGVVLGIIISHAFKSAIDPIYTKIPVLGTLGANARQYY